MGKRSFWGAVIALGLLGCEAQLGVPDGQVGADGGPSEVDGGRDAGVDASLDAGPPDAGTDAATDGGPPVELPPAPGEIFFVGNSFTFGGPVPRLVEDLAIYAGFEPPNVEYRAVGGQSLQGHRADTAAEGAPARVAEGWDVVVLQELSVRPTDSIGPAERFKEDATWFYDLAKDANPECEVVLYQTWARRAGHAFYPSRFADPADMQAQLRFHYADAAERYIPLFARSARARDVRVAPVGDAWERQLAGGEPPRLHADDDYHAGRAGQYLNALVLYSTIFRRRSEGSVPLNGLDEATAARLQASADATTGAIGYGPLRGPPLAVEDGDGVRVDLGPLWVDGWPTLPSTRLTVGPIATQSGLPSTARVTAWGFTGVQEGGRADNTLGLEGDVSRDSLWVGSFDGHAAALGMEARVVIRGLPVGRYRVELFASRTGNDSGNGRLTRYRIEDSFVDLEVADNRGEVATFDGVSPDARGEILVRVGVSPAGRARFAYVGALWVTRTGD